MVTPQQILFGLVLPLVVALVCALIGGFISRGSSGGATLGLIIGFVLAFHTFLEKWPPVNAKEAPLGLGAAVVALGLVAMALSVRRVPWFVRGVLVILAPAAVVWYVFKPLPAASMPQPFWQWMAAAAVFVVVTTAAVEWIAHRSGGVAATLSLGPMAAGAGLICMLSGNNNMGLIGTSIAVMVFGLFVAALISKRVSVTRGPALVVTTVIGAMIAWGYFDREEIKPVEMILLAIAPLLGLVPEVPALHKRKAWQREIIRVALVAVPVLVAVGLAKAQFDKSSSETGSGSEQLE